MAWNEPGGQKPRDPWGGGGKGGGNNNGGNNDQGPPDLDEVIRNLKDKLGGAFGGGGKSSGGGSGGGAASGGIAVVVIAVLLFVYVFWAFFQVDSAEQGVVLRFGKLHRIVDPGLNWHLPPFEEYHKVNVTQVNSHRISEEMLSGDTNIVSVTLDVQYRVLDPAAYLLKVANSESVLRNATESALRHVVGSKTINAVLSSERESLRSEVQTRLQDYLDTYSTGLLVSAVVLDSTQAPAAVRDAFQDVTRAREDEDRFQKEAESYANAIIPEARGRAQRLREEAEAYRAEVEARATGEADRFMALLTEYNNAPEVTRERLYIETMQEVIGNSSKVLVDVKGGDSLIYLPLDQIMKQHQDRSSSSSSDAPERTSVPSRDGSTNAGSSSSGTRSSSQQQSLYGRSREVR